MDHHRADRRATPAESRSVTEILSDARDMQSRHAPRLFGAAASWLRDRLVPRAGDHSNLVARRLVVH